MTKKMLIALTFATIAGFGLSRTAQAAASQSWSGFMLRDGVQVPIALELAATSADASGRVRIGNTFIALDHLRLTGAGVHFDLPGEGAFDGTVAGNLMAGSVSGSATAGSFALTREAEQAFEVYPMGP
jgi:hypothetical protein